MKTWSQAWFVVIIRKNLTLSILSMACTVPLKDYLTLVMLRVNDTSLLQERH
jgi:hypothetical protein